uniref:Mismatch repair endonuclease PMS2 n=1 Tax=Phallusia mammillata TaxID=59560 RepID=A0A6F9DP53_9ASCI|nr:mismatch repair endonuclease PMS2-like [Phallusia mammillata]
MAEIKAINKSTVHQICSGQVVLDLATAVKELVENSLDAKATSIEIKLKEYGSEQIEVSDNGIGVQEKNFAALTLKHYTSKLQEFVDLSSIGTFGFRGEALSSLCALCDVTISTRHKDTSIGHKLEYDHNGKIIKKSQVARQIGTTVQLKNIFSTLPVRLNEFKRNIKKEYAKLLSLMNAYCIISTHVRLSCSNQTSKGKKTVLLSTQGAPTIKQNIVTVFGSKQFELLSEFKQINPTFEVCEDYHLKEDEVNEVLDCFSVNGWLSKIGHTHGRSSPDRQYYFINSRPVDVPRVSKLVNEVYHMFNRHQYPFVALNIEMRRDAVDVNVTPDKRQVFLQGEKVLLAIVKSSLLQMFTSNGCHVVDSCTRPSPRLSFDVADCSKGDIEKESALTLTPDRATLSRNSDTEETSSPTVSLLSKFRRKDSPLPTTITRKRPSTQGFNSPSVVAKQPRMDRFFSPSSVQKSDLKTFGKENVTKQDTSDFETSEEDVSPLRIGNVLEIKRPQAEVYFDSENTAHTNGEIGLPNDKQALEDREFYIFKEHTIHNDSNSNDQAKTNIVYDKAEETHEIGRESLRTAKFSMKTISSRLKILQDMESTGSFTRSSSFQAKITPGQNTDAEKELSRNLNKTAFFKMDVLGQFNLGFVVARYKNDLFIIDQHASDEIYNFETLQRCTEIHTQKLMIPQRLNLTAADKLVLVENISIFQRNGFDFNITEDSVSGQDQVFLNRVPMSKNWDFGSADVDELIFMLSDAPGVFCRPSRIRQMFASRACRKSVMIGTALNAREMRRLLDHMAEIEHPWNCPHGRPTMRHILDLSRIATT